MTILRIGLLFEFPTLNGGENSMLAVLDGITNAGLGQPMELIAIAPAEDGPLSQQLHDRSIPVVPFCVRDAAGDKRDPRELADELRAAIVHHRIDVLHSNSLSMCRFVGRCRDHLPESLCCTGHLRDIMRLSQTAVRDINRNDALIAVSAATRDFHIQQGLNAARCRVIHNGIDAHVFSGTSDRTERQTVLPNVPPDAKILLNVGQICLRKNQLLLAKAVVLLLQHRDDLHLVMAGERHSTKAESHAFERAIRDEFRAHDKDHHVHGLGFRQDVSSLMSVADLLVHTSEQEPFGRTLLEAASCGLPIIATDVGGTSEMLRQDVDALLIPPRDVKALCAAIEAAIDNRAVASLRADSASKRIRAMFDIRTTAQRTCEFWQLTWQHHVAGSESGDV